MSVLAYQADQSLILRISHFQSGAEKPMALMLGMGAFMSFFTFATPLLVHYVSKKYVTEMYYNRITDTYTAITYSLFLRKNQVSCSCY